MWLLGTVLTDWAACDPGSRHCLFGPCGLPFFSLLGYLVSDGDLVNAETPTSEDVQYHTISAVCLHSAAPVRPWWQHFECPVPGLSWSRIGSIRTQMTSFDFARHLLVQHWGLWHTCVVAVWIQFSYHVCDFSGVVSPFLWAPQVSFLLVEVPRSSSCFCIASEWSEGHSNALLFLVTPLSLADVSHQGQQLPCLIRGKGRQCWPWSLQSQQGDEHCKEMLAYLGQ